jgi:TonB family protein
MLTRIILLSGICLFFLNIAVAQEKSDKALTAPELPTCSPRPSVPLDVGPGIAPPRAIFSPDPDYPESARKRKIHGTCVLGLTVDECGRVHDVHITRSEDKRLDQNAIEAVKRWTFKPAMKDGKTVAVFTSVEVDFSLY